MSDHVLTRSMPFPLSDLYQSSGANQYADLQMLQLTGTGQLHQFVVWKHNVIHSESHGKGYKQIYKTVLIYINIYINYLPLRMNYGKHATKWTVRCSNIRQSKWCMLVSTDY